MSLLLAIFLLFFFTDTATTVIYTLSLHDALPISRGRYRRLHREAAHHAQRRNAAPGRAGRFRWPRPHGQLQSPLCARSEEHTSELQSRRDLVCRLLLEKKNNRRRMYDDFSKSPSI